MKRALSHHLVLIGLLLAIIGINVLLYPGTSGEEEEEWNGDRSIYSPRPYGTRAFFLLLKEMGYPVVAYEESFDHLTAHRDIGGLFVIGTRLPLTAQELEALEEWVQRGGWLIIIDRKIDWTIAEGTIRIRSHPKFRRWRRPRVIQPTAFTRGVERIHLTEYAHAVTVESAPVTEHIGDATGALLVDFAHGRGRIIVLGEPHIVANNGLNQGDNLALALNIVRQIPRSTIAFDEYHHGYGASPTNTRTGPVGVLLNLYDYFKGTPVIWIIFQAMLIAASSIYSRGRRFTRPRPLTERRRTRSLEYVAAMGDLARRLNLTSLIVENVRSGFRRRCLRPNATALAGQQNDVEEEFAARRAGGSRWEFPVPPLEPETTDVRALIRWVQRLRHIENQMRKRP